MEKAMCQPKIMRPAAVAVLALTLLTAGSASAGANVLQRGEMTGSAPSLYRPCTEAVALTLQSDFAVFMQPDCPEAVRIEALRQLWRLLPPAELPESMAF
jgi:hypothetical protein